MFYTVALQNARDECLQADAHSKSVGTIEATNKNPRIKRLLWYMLIIPVVFSVFLWLLGTYATREYVPNSLDVHVWRNFSTHVKQSVQAIDTHYPHNVLLVLLCIHAVQVLFCFPLIHVSKIMYGYFFGVLWGGVMCCVWELFLVCVFVVVATQNNPSNHSSQKAASDLAGFLHYVNNLRSKHLVFPFLLAMHASSVPLVTATCLVLFQIVGQWEFISSHAIVTVFMTFKDTWLGNFLASSDGNASNIAIAATMLSISELLPAVIAIVLMGIISSSSSSASISVCESEEIPEAIILKHELVEPKDQLEDRLEDRLEDKLRDKM